VSSNSAYLITWQDAHGDQVTTTRYGKQAAEFITEIFNIGCHLISVELERE
jgi:hypothetical protein